MTHAGKTWKLAIVQPEGRFKPPVWLRGAQTSLDRNSASFSSGVQNPKTQTLQWTTQTCVADAHAIEPQARTKKVYFHVERKTAQNGNHLTFYQKTATTPNPNFVSGSPNKLDNPLVRKETRPRKRMCETRLKEAIQGRRRCVTFASMEWDFSPFDGYPGLEHLEGIANGVPLVSTKRNFKGCPRSRHTLHRGGERPFTFGSLKPFYISPSNIPKQTDSTSEIGNQTVMLKANPVTC